MKKEGNNFLSWCRHLFLLVPFLFHDLTLHPPSFHGNDFSTCSSSSWGVEELILSPSVSTVNGGVHGYQAIVFLPPYIPTVDHGPLQG